jgi:4-diphosphocytidyl-2-C-methyl-D-erythritol kinase
LDRLTLQSPAKINLSLEVLKKREDGFHQIRSLMQAVDLFDELILEKRPKDVVISCDHPGCPADETNLAFKAASLLLKEEKADQGVSVHITKRIPISAGLGGGSSNAAAALKGVRQLLELDISDRRLGQLAARVGSDVPFFLHSGQAVVEGRGEEIRPIRIYGGYWLVLVCPGIQVSTRWAYQNLKINLTKKTGGVSFSNLEDASGFFEALLSFENDLEEVVIKRHAVIQRIKDNLENSGAVKSSMSGSGPTVYGVFDRKPQAEEVARELLRGDWQTFLTRPIPG